MNGDDIRRAAERSGTISGYQRMSFGIDHAGSTNKIVQTAFDETDILVRQRPDEYKNNLYNVKEWNAKTYYKFYMVIFLILIRLMKVMWPYMIWK